MPARLLIVDDEPAICFALSRYFRERGDDVTVASSAEDAINKLPAARPDAIFLDIRLPGISGLEAMERLQKDEGRRMKDEKGGQGTEAGRGSTPADRAAANSQFTIRNPQSEISAEFLPPALIIMTAHGTMEAAIEAMRRGAYDYLVKPVSLDKAGQLVDRLMQSRAARRREAEEKRGRELFSSVGGSSGGASIVARDSATMVGTTAAMQELFKQIGAVAARTMPVLVLGETGSGKELVARAIHAHGPRAKNPFVPINAAALPDTLIESELFGFEKGAFTGADRKKPGRFEEADTGTLFLDEIGELPPAAQAKLLRFLDEPVVSRLGSNELRRVDVRLVTATHRDLQQLVDKGQFRADLLYRLNVARVRVPPLRERRDDLPALAEFLLARLSADTGQGGAVGKAIVSAEAMERLRAHDWPGNVRELRNVLQQALLVARDGVILPGHLPPLARAQPGDDVMARRIATALQASSALAYDTVILPVERELLRQVMEMHEGNLSRAADQLGMHRATLRTKLRQHGLAEPPGS